MARLAVLLLALVVAPAAGSEGMITKMTGMVASAKKLMGGASPIPCTGTACCAKSKCYKWPAMGCKGSRGLTECVGGGYTHAGTCSCRSGACGTNGQCPALSGASTDAYSTGQASMSRFQRLFEEQDTSPAEGPIEPEDFTVAFCLLGAFAGFLALGATTLGMRLRRRHAAPAEAEEHFVTASEDPLGVE
eukprot:CAMPEP_0195064446 /NCGR_PEP_ID=MMETSP0448-20130528/10484_1 /TAXON_ID=66468 /ORGANISM="Heterocapsa triquestra, Strain CCMP 448" /LENGTH=189 /DNA_ID=CAMNT_0040095455 /DNA_START=70 /DNA_END=639 /DNA_ORIENTATION=+